MVCRLRLSLWMRSRKQRTLQAQDACDRPAAGVNIYFLFRGEQPLELTIYTPQPVSLVVQPHADNTRRFDRDLTTWWRHQPLERPFAVGARRSAQAPQDQLLLARLSIAGDL